MTNWNLLWKAIQLLEENFSIVEVLRRLRDIWPYQLDQGYMKTWNTSSTQTQSWDGDYTEYDPDLRYKEKIRVQENLNYKFNSDTVMSWRLHKVWSKLNVYKENQSHSWSTQQTWWERNDPMEALTSQEIGSKMISKHQEKKWLETVILQSMKNWKNQVSS
jgi:hypothetical protein